MPAVHTERSIVINASPAVIHQALTDFKQWVPWSPWLIMEPECQVTYADDGNSYSWDGNRIGAGEMSIAEQSDTCIEYDLNFIRPFKSYARVKFLLESQGAGASGTTGHDNAASGAGDAAASPAAATESSGQATAQTKVTWTMSSSLPFFLFWMRKSMEVYIGADYERGLGMLKPYIETGLVPSKLGFVGPADYPGCQYIGLNSQMRVAELPSRIEADCTALISYLDSAGVIDGKLIASYHKFDRVKDIVSYTVCMPVSRVPADLPAEFCQGETPPLKAYQLTHTGPYQHIGNAWSTLQQMVEGKELKPDRRHSPFELYVNSPGEVADSELLTEIWYPVV